MSSEGRFENLERRLRELEAELARLKAAAAKSPPAKDNTERRGEK